MSALGIPRWSWGGSAPGGWQREYLEWLVHYRRTGYTQDAPRWSVWIAEWPSWTQRQRIAHVRMTLASLPGWARHEAHRTHKLRMDAPTRSGRREWSRLALTARLAARMTLAEVMAGQNGSEDGGR